MASTGATNAYREIRFSFALVLRQQICKQLSKAPERLFDFRLIFEIFHDSPIGAGQGTQTVNKKWVRQVTHIKQQLHVPGRSESMSKTQDLHPQVETVFAAAKPVEQKPALRMDGVFRRVDNFI